MPSLTNGIDKSTANLEIQRERLRRERLRRNGGLSQSQDTQSTFASKYWDRPDQFILDCFVWRGGEGPTDYQLEMARDLAEFYRLCGRGCHGLGKTAWNSWIILWFATTRDAAGVDWKCPTTAGAWRQLTKFLWPEVHKWARRLRWDVLGREPFNTIHELQTLSLKLKHGEAFAVASDNPELIEGAHADQLLYIFDESKAIKPETFDAAEGAFSNTGANDRTRAYAAAMSTPGEPQGRFYSIQSRKDGFEDWKVVNVTFDEVIAAGRATPAWGEQRRKQWGADSAVYKNRVLGEFASSDEDGVIPLSWIERANARWLEWQDAIADSAEAKGNLEIVSCDVADSGNDKTVIALKYGNGKIDALRYCAKQDTMQTTGMVSGILSSAKEAGNGNVIAIADSIGVGAGVVARLREQGFDVVAFNASEKTDKRDRSGELGFINKRAAAWWNVRELLDPSNGEEVALPPDDTLISDLTAPHWKVVSTGKVQVESKDDLRKRLSRSTDAGDVVVMALWQDNFSLGGVFRL